MSFANPQSGPSGPQQDQPQQQQQQQQPQPPPPFQQPPFPGMSSAGAAPSPNGADDPQFDIFEWYPQYQSCQRYFLDHAQHATPVQAVAAFVNITLPFQREYAPYASFALSQNSAYGAGSVHPTTHTLPQTNWVSLVPYVRRLVATGLDIPGVLHGFFGDDWTGGVGPLHEQERRNYLFSAKSGGWANVKRDYDMSPWDTVPFLRPLHDPVDAEIEGAEKTWSEWLAMEDWMLGSRAPENMDRTGRAGRSRQ